MKGLPPWILLRGSLKTRQTQLVLTFICVALTFLLLGLLASAASAFHSQSSLASTRRLRTQGVGSTVIPLPLQYRSTIAQVPGVTRVSYAAASAAAYQENPQHFLLQIVSQDTFLDTFPELKLKSGGDGAWLADKQALIAGSDVLLRYNWQIGQLVTLQTNIANSTGEGNWQFHVVSSYVSTDPSVPNDLVFVRYDYLNEGRLDGKNNVLGFISTIGDSTNAFEIASSIDKALSGYVQTQPENLATQEQLAQFRDLAQALNTAGAAVVITMLLLSHNVWYDRAYLQRVQYATLRAIGYSRLSIYSLILSEALAITVVSAMTGLLLSAAVVYRVRPIVSQYLSGFHFPRETLLLGIAISMIFAAIAATVPAFRLARANVGVALRQS